MNSLAASLWILIVSMSDGGKIAINEPGLLFNHEIDCRVAKIYFAEGLFEKELWARDLYDKGLLAIECIPAELVEVQK
jgi:hypothetical protein